MAQAAACSRELRFALLLSLLALTAPGASAEDLSTYINTGGGESVITISPAKRAASRIPRTIYGTFLEHIGSSVFGGVSSQLLDNPSLEPYPANLENLTRRFSSPVYQQSTRFGLPLPWIPLRPTGRRYESRTGDAPNSTAYLYLMGLPDREVGIRQTVYLPIERTHDYRGILFGRAAEGPATLSVSFRHHDRPDAILAETRLPVAATRQWLKLPFHLKLSAGALAPLESVDFTVAVKDGARISIDEIRLYPADAFEDLDPDIVSRAKELRSPLLRYGGNFSSGYHWRDGIGPLDSRPTRLNAAWGVPEYNDFGTDELMAFCRRIGAQPQICLNLGSGTAQEARDWVEYCQGSPTSPNGRRRAANGHPEPYTVAAWEFGNELYDDTQLGWYKPEAYSARYLEFFRAIEPVLPPETRLLATGGELNAYQKWNAALQRTAGPQLQYITTHLVADLQDTRNRALDPEAVLAAALALPVGAGRALGRLREQIEAEPSTRGRVKLAYTEWMFRSPESARLPNYDDMGAALIGAGWLNMLTLKSDWIPIANMTGLVEFAGIHKSRGRTYVAPQYWALYLHTRYAGDTVIATETRSPQYDVHGGQVFAPEISGVPLLDVLGTAESTNSAVTLFVVNRSPHRPQPVTIRFDGFTPATSARVLTLAAHSLLDKNDDQHPEAIYPVETRTVVEHGTLRQSFPPGSLTVLLISQKQ
ncbi:MAG: alpha-L-arabinofuranosidase C-terminal domain-containing protein [Bryobacteraceae bacterium]